MISQVFDGSNAELLPKSAAECADILRKHNEWRRGGDGEQSNPKELGLAIDMAISALDQQPDIDTLEQESRQIRARMLRLEQEASDKDEQVECSTIAKENMEGRLDKALIKLTSITDQRNELLAALVYVIEDLEIRASMKLDEDERDVVDLGNGAYEQAKRAIASVKGGAA